MNHWIWPIIFVLALICSLVLFEDRDFISGGIGFTASFFSMFCWMRSRKKGSQKFSRPRPETQNNDKPTGAPPTINQG